MWEHGNIGQFWKRTLGLSRKPPGRASESTQSSVLGENVVEKKSKKYKVYTSSKIYEKKVLIFWHMREMGTQNNNTKLACQVTNKLHFDKKKLINLIILLTHFKGVVSLTARSMTI